MSMTERTTQYPAHLAKLVATRLRSQTGHAPPDVVLTRLLETLYFASLKTDEGWQILCTVNYVDPDEPLRPPGSRPADSWAHVPFERPLPFDVRTLAKLARAADPAVSSLAVYRDKRNKLFIWGMFDQEPRHSELISLAASTATPERPGLFQATITGVGSISVYQNDTLIGSLEQTTLVEEYHDVLWAGPVHELLVRGLRSYLAETASKSPQHTPPEIFEAELLMRWINAVCRVLMNIQRYRHGGGLLITPSTTLDGLNVKYKIRYDRLLKALRGMVEAQLAAPAAEPDAARDLDANHAILPYVLGGESVFDGQLVERMKEVLGAVRFIASLSCVDGFVLLDQRMVAHGFGVEVRTDNLLSDISVARDSHANPKLMRHGELTQYGTRHRAMMRYCYDKPGALGFVVSQDGYIRAMTRIAETLVLWENVDVQLAYRPAGGYMPGQQPIPMLRRANARVA
jgi:Probable sensor domain DACNV